MSLAQFIQELKYKPEPVKRKIFIVSMVVFFLVMAMVYVFSIRNSIAYSLNESASHTEGLPGEFQLPGIKESLMANVKDIMQGINGIGK
ncbi:hypothetical protein A2Z10_00850 [Candidatus Azambacteria bacterium RBG_16_47_10]|uniref:Uncharacterized protein n=1 Tax=Candidatus Azambacteria bacterium RBG_16_47_10 TaxID=1797292 RepID=A0A1F5B125_9BACT|nr:MAG: hypothetical protein A2Z10_00850 [Candidatus Azambacteria bacterium RBG_16_47_10]